MRPIKDTNEAVETLYDLNVGVIGTGPNRHERPHKPLLLLTVLDLIATGHASPERVSWSQELRGRFLAYFAVVRCENDQNTPENPFYYMRGDGFWQPVEIQRGEERPLASTPTVTQANAGTVFARIIGGMEALVRTPEQRMKIREALVSRYFPIDRDQITTLFAERAFAAEQAQALSMAAEAPTEYAIPGRSPAFRRKVLEVQCAACGLRIKLPDADSTFVDGAHLIPFQEGRNDHPTNGLALCKNHHWAMDRFLLVPTPERTWKASPRLDARRSIGERDLVSLDGEPILPPHDDAFTPAAAGLAWRFERLLS
jgi:putative restriction endonuclease